DSNQRMPGSKPGALPLGDAPVGNCSMTDRNSQPVRVNGRGGWIRTNACQDQNLVPYRLATPRYRSPAIRHSLPVQGFQHTVQRRPVAAASDEAWQSGWKLARDSISLVAIWEAPKHTSSSAGHACLNEIIQPLQSVTNFAVAL